MVIGGGHTVSRDADLNYRVAKVQLVSVLQAMLSSHRLKIATGLPETGILVAELKTFSAKITAAGNEKYEALRERDHDDMVLAVAMALWLAENAPRGRFEIY
jgi:hypothetical protein